MLIGNYLPISITKVAIFLAISSIKELDFLQTAGIFKVLKNRKLQIREIQNPELQGLPLLAPNYFFFPILSKSHQFFLNHFQIFQLFFVSK